MKKFIGNFPIWTFSYSTFNVSEFFILVSNSISLGFNDIDFGLVCTKISNAHFSPFGSLAVIVVLPLATPNISTSFILLIFTFILAIFSLSHFQFIVESVSVSTETLLCSPTSTTIVSLNPALNLLSYSSCVNTVPSSKTIYLFPVATNVML